MNIDPETTEILLSAALGLGLAAACGFRIFVPLLVMSVASASGYLELSQGFQWVGTTPALITLAVATALEIAAYYLPWVDNLLDVAGAPAAVVAGTVVAASTVTGMDPMLKWGLAAIAGGGAAGAVHGAMAVVRKASSLTTLGMGNPVISTAEAGGSLALSGLAVVMPVVSLIVLAMFLVLTFVIARRILLRRRQRTLQQPA